MPPTLPQDSSGAWTSGLHFTPARRPGYPPHNLGFLNFLTGFLPRDLSQPPHSLPPALIFLGVSFPSPPPFTCFIVHPLGGVGQRYWGLLSQRDGGRGVRCKFEGGRMGKMYLHTGYWEPGAAGGGGWAGGGGQKADHQGCREQTRYLELGGRGKKGNQRSYWESRCQRWGYSGNQGKPGLSEGWEARAGVGAVALPQGVTPPLSPQLQFLPPTLTP